MHITPGMTNLMLTEDTLTAHSHFFLCCGYLLPGPSGLHSEVLGLIPLVVQDSNPWKGPSMACLPSTPAPAMSLSCLLCPDFTYRMLLSSIFFCTPPKFPSKFYTWVYSSTFCSSSKIPVPHQLRTTVLAIRLDNCSPKFLLGKTPRELIGFSGRLVLSRKGKVLASRRL